MKKLHKILLVAGVALVVCVCVVVGCILLFRSDNPPSANPPPVDSQWCDVTFVCVEGCEHTTRQRIGETIDYSLAHDAHYDHHISYRYEPAGIFSDEARTQYCSDTTLTEPSMRFYLGIWSTKFSCTHFYTPLGDVRIFLAKEELQGIPREERYAYVIALVSEKFYAAYEALGGNRESQLGFAYRAVPYTNKWETVDLSTIATHMDSFEITFGLAELYYSVEYALVFPEGYLQDPIENPFGSDFGS